MTSPMTSPVTSPMTGFCVTYLDAGRAPVTVTAERYAQQGLHWVFWGSHTVMNRPRAVVVFRVAQAEVADIAGAASP